MKKILLFTLTLLLMFTLMGCPSRVNRNPNFVRVTKEAENINDIEFIRLQSLTEDMYLRAKSTFENDPDNDGKEFDYKEEFGNEYIIYEHTQGTDFHPNNMVDHLINEQNVLAIDYIQDYVEIGADRKFEDISENIIVTSFYDIWTEDDFGDPMSAEEEELLGQIKTDDDGNFVFDTMKIMLVEFLPVGDIMAFSLEVSDHDGATSTIDGIIVIVPSN